MLRLRLFAVVLCLIGVLPVYGQDGDNELDLESIFEVMTSTAERFHSSDQGSAYTWVGNVHLKGPVFELYADAAALVFPPDGTQFKVLALGHILLVHDDTTFRAERLFYDSATDEAVLHSVRLRGDLETIESASRFVKDPNQLFRMSQEAEAPQQERFDVGAEAEGHHESRELVIAARRLTTRGFQDFEGEDIEISTCVFQRPHWSLTAESVRVEKRDQGYLIDLSTPWVRWNGHKVLPLPPLSLDTKWIQNLPLRSISYSNSSKYGSRVNSVWDGNMLIPKSLRSKADFAIYVDYLQKRGTGYGGEIEYGNRGDHYGIATYWGIEDRGIDSNSTTPPEHRSRNRMRWYHQSLLKSGTWVDLEYSVEREANFLNEYFERETRNQKAPENLIYARHQVREDIAVTMLAKKRMVPYRQVVERLPELSFLAVERPLGETGVDLDVVARGSYLRFLPRNTDSLNSQRMARGDVKSTLAYSLGRSRIVKVRPFFEARFTAWEEDEVRNNAIERLSLASGARAGMHLSRVFDVNNSLFDIRGLKHVIDPGVRYRVVFENNVDPTELFQYDETETVDRREVVTLELRNTFYTRSRRKEAATDARRLAEERLKDKQREATLPEAQFDIRRVLEADLEIDYFPDPSRDNTKGDPFGDLRHDVVFYPRRNWVIFSNGETNVEEGGHFETYNAGFGGPMFGDSYFTVENRYSQHLAHDLSTTFRVRLSDRYEAAAFYQYDLRDTRTVNSAYAIVRNLHRFALVISVELDRGEDNVEFNVRFGPRELWDTLTGKGYR